MSERAIHGHRKRQGGREHKQKSRRSERLEGRERRKGEDENRNGLYEQMPRNNLLPIFLCPSSPLSLSLPSVERFCTCKNEDLVRTDRSKSKRGWFRLPLHPEHSNAQEHRCPESYCHGTLLPALRDVPIKPCDSGQKKDGMFQGREGEQKWMRRLLKTLPVHTVAGIGSTNKSQGRKQRPERTDTEASEVMEPS